MNEVIYKQALEVESSQMVDLPENAEVLCVQVQRGVPCIWYLCDPAEPKFGRRFYTYGTGQYADPFTPKRYIGTYQLADGDLVFHVFEEKRADG